MGKPLLVAHCLIESQVEVRHKSKLPGLAVEYRTDYYCEVCGQSWREWPQSQCPGAKIYAWQPWPDGLLTRKQLAAKRLNPGLLAGVIRYDKSADGDGWLRLYRESEATPKPALTEKQQVTVEKMRVAAEAARLCSRCGRSLHDRRELRARQCEACSFDLMAEHDKIRAAQTAYDLVCQGDFVVWDSETTDLNGRFVEIAVIDAFGKPLLNERIRPGCLISPGAYEVHGIRDEDLVGAPAFFDIYHCLRTALHRRHWIVYNSAFDTDVLYRETHYSAYRSYYANFPIEAHGDTCAMLLYAAFNGDWHGYYKNYRWQKLDSAAQHFDIHVEEPAHSALGDCLRTLELLYAMADWYRKEIS